MVLSIKKTWFMQMKQIFIRILDKTLPLESHFLPFCLSAHIVSHRPDASFEWYWWLQWPLSSQGMSAGMSAAWQYWHNHRKIPAYVTAITLPHLPNSGWWCNKEFEFVGITISYVSYLVGWDEIDMWLLFTWNNFILLIDGRCCKVASENDC